MTTQRLDTILEHLLPIIRQFEGCKLTSYQCPAGVWTCGWGATGESIGPSTKWTQEVADRALRDTASDVIAQVIIASPTLADVPATRVAALADFVYNLGIGNYNSSTLKECVDNSDWVSASTEILRWDKCNGKTLAGLTRRRAVESKLLD